jgi:hypothetical protein
MSVLPRTDWTLVLVRLAEATKGVLSGRPKLGRPALVKWARAEARKGAEVSRLSPAATKQIDAIVDSAIAVAAASS